MTSPRPSVLVVDDVADAAESLALLLALHGFAVRTAPDGPSALAHLTAAPPDAVLCDIRMPGMDGWAFARRARELTTGRPLVLVAVSGLCQEGDRRHSLDAGFDHHLDKPVDPAAVVTLLRHHLGSPAQQSADGGE
jgi:CheY-like chemotaxis protein